MAERKSDSWVSIFLSVLLHGAVIALLVYGWLIFRHPTLPAQPQTLAIEAVAIESKPQGKAPTPPPEPPPPQPEPAPEEDTGPPTPTAEEMEQRKAAEREAEAQRQAEKERKEAEQKQAEEKQKRAEEKKHAEREAEAKRLAEKKRQDDEKRKEDEKKKLEEARQRAQREAELRRSLEQEQHVMAARSSGMLASWQAQIAARIQRAWLRPPSARSGIDCMVYVTQVPGGEVAQVRVGTCNGDQAVRESIEAAVYRASPLPPPPDPALFERNLEIRFKPVD